MKKVIIIHGWTYSTEKWKPFIDLLEKSGVSVDLLKVPGLTAEINRPWTIDDYVNWLKEIVEKDDDKKVIIGHSNGGRIALAFASKYPKQISRLILINSAGIHHDGLSLKIKRNMFNTVAKIGRKLTSSENLRKVLYKLVGESDYRKASPNTAKTMVNLISSDITPKLSEINVPTLIIWGEKDTHNQTPLSDAKLMNKLIKNSKLRTVKDAKHSPQLTNPNEVLAFVLEAIK